MEERKSDHHVLSTSTELRCSFLKRWQRSQLLTGDASNVTKALQNNGALQSYPALSHRTISFYFLEPNIRTQATGTAKLLRDNTR